MKKDHLSYSALTQFKKSPNHLLAYWEGKQKRTDAMLFGSLIHKIILEPETFDFEYVVYQGKARRGKDWIEFSELNKNKTTSASCSIAPLSLKSDNCGRLEPVRCSTALDK